MKEIIVDIETLSTKSNACVLTIGAILFGAFTFGSRFS
jgi:hypothetical protein